MEEDFGIIPFPKYSAEQEAYYTHVDGHAPLMILPKTLTNPENAGIVLEALAYESNKTVVPAVYEIVLQSKYARDEASQRMLDLILEGRVYTFGYIYDDWKGMQWTLQVLMKDKSKDSPRTTNPIRKGGKTAPAGPEILRKGSGRGLTGQFRPGDFE